MGRLFLKNIKIQKCDLNQRFSTQITPQPVFEEKNFHDPATEDFHHLQTC